MAKIYIYHYVIIPIDYDGPYVLTLRMYAIMTIELHRHDSEFPVLKVSSQ